MFRVAWKPASARPRRHLRRQCAALLLWLAPLPLLALTLRQENFESPSDGTNYTVIGEFGLANSRTSYFKRGANGNFAFSVNPLLGVHGTNFFGGEHTSFNSVDPSQVTLGSIDVRGHNNLRITWAVAIARDAAFVNLSPGAVGLYYSSDYMILQTALDGGAWSNVSIFRGTNDVAGFLSEDKDKNGIGDADGPTLTRTFTDFQYAIPGGAGTSVQARVLMYMGRSGAEAAFDDIRVTGDNLPPSITITNPAGAIVVSSATTNYNVQGTASAGVVGHILWTNSLTGLKGTIPASANWAIPGVTLGAGVNLITVTGSNTVGALATNSVAIAREGTILLNEVLANPVGADAAGSLEFIELLNLAGGGNAGDLSIVELSGNGANKGVVAARWNLTGLTFGANGLLAVGDNYDVTLGGAWSNQVSPHTRLADAGYVPDALLDTSITLLLVRNCQVSVTNGADLDANNDGVLDVAPWDAILDSVGWKDADVGDVVYRSAALTQTSDWPDGASRLQTNRVPQDPSAWFNGDVMTSGGDTLGRTYNGAAASLNLPAGAVLTPGRPNYPFPYDQDGDGLPNAWEQQYFGGATNGAPGADADEDGQSNQNEYWAGTNPTNAASFFEVKQIGISGITSQEIYTNGPDIVTQTVLTVSGNVLNWDSLTNRIYETFGRGNMTNPFVRLQGGIAATPPLNVYTAAIGTNRTFYFRIGVLEPVYP